MYAGGHTGIRTFTNGKSLSMPMDAARAVLPVPAGPSSSAVSSGVLALFRTYCMVNNRLLSYAAVTQSGQLAASCSAT